MLKPTRRYQVPLICMAALLAVTIGGAALAQETAKPGDQQLINIDVKDAPVEQVLRMLAKAANVNILIGQDVKGTVPAISLRDVSVDAALRLIAKSQGFYWYKDDNVYVVSAKPGPIDATPDSTGGGQLTPTAVAPLPAGGGPAAAPVTPGVAPVQLPAPTLVAPTPAVSSGAARHNEPRIVPAMIKLAFADSGQLAIMFGGSICTGGTAADYFANMTPPSAQRRALSRGGRGLGSADVFSSGLGTTGGGVAGWGQNLGGGGGGRAGGNQGGGGRGGAGGGLGGGQGGGGRQGGGGGGANGGALSDMLPGDMLPPIAFMPENALLVQGTQEEIDKFKEILALLDKPTKQVEIATKFINITTTADKALGIDWSLSNGSLEFFNQGFAPGEAVNNVIRFARGRFEGQLNALLSSGRATVINEPHVIAMNNQYAEVNFSTTIPYFTANISYNQFGQRTVDFTSDFVDVENSLWVVPRINADDSITVHLEPELQDNVGEVEGPNGERIPIITTQYVSTTVRVADGETVVLGGLVRKDESMTLRETPLLSSIPIIGKLFRGKRVNKSNSELLIFVTPRVVHEAPAQ
jgi:type II secretory pathway component GspD/PulD (secretin)